MRTVFIFFGLALIATSGYGVVTGRQVPLSRGWNPNDPPSTWWRLVNVVGVLVGGWLLLTGLMGISPFPPFR